MFKNGDFIGLNDRNGKPINIGDDVKYIYQETNGQDDFVIGQFKYYKDLLAIGFENKENSEDIMFFNTECCTDFNSNDFEVIE